MSVPARDERPMVYGEAERFVYRMSACGSCVRALVAARLGFQPEPAPRALEEAAEEGALLEPGVLEHLEREGWRIADRQREVEIPLPSALIRGHVDGIATREGGEVLVGDRLVRPGERLVVEVKTMSRAVFARWLAGGFEDNYFRRYAVQVSLAMHATGLPGLYVVYCRERPEPPGGRWSVRVLDEPPVPVQDILLRMAEVEFAARRGELPPCDTEHRSFCPYRYLHEDEGEAEAPEGLNEVAFAQWARQYVEAQEMIRKYEAIRDAARERLLRVCGYRPSDPSSPERVSIRVRVGAWTATVYEQVRETCDLARLRAELGERAEEFIRKSRFAVLRLTATSR